MLIEVYLAKAKEPLQIPYPKKFTGDKSGNFEDKEFHISTLPRYITKDEFAIAQQYVTKLPYSQSVIKTGAVLIGNDPLADKDHDYLDHVEQIAGLNNTRSAASGGERQPFERVLLIRERGYDGNGYQALNESH